MKLLQMLKLTRLRKLLSRQAKEPVVTVKNTEEMSGKEVFEELCRENQIGDMLSSIMNEHKMVYGHQEVSPCPASRQATVSLGQLAAFPPTQLRNIQKTFMREPTALRYYSDKTLDALLVEWAENAEGDFRHTVMCRKADPTVLITKRPGYERKIDGKYH